MTTKLLVLVSIVTWFMGCATTPPPPPPDNLAANSETQQPGIRRVALVTTLEPPVIERVALGYTRSEGASRGAVKGLIQGGDAALDVFADCSDIYCTGAFVLLLPVFLVGGAVIGAAGGVATGHSSDTLAEAQANAQAMLDSAYLQTEVLHRARDYGLANVNMEFIEIPSLKLDVSLGPQGYAGVSDKSIDLVLEIDLLRIGLKTSLEIEAQARLVSVRTGDVLSDSHYSFVSERHKLDEWTENGAAPLRNAIQRGLQTLAEDIVNENFLLYYPKAPDSKSAEKAKEPSPVASKAEGEAGPNKSLEIDWLLKKAIPYYVLKPLYPEFAQCLFCTHGPIGILKFVPVDSTQPTLRWETFPRSHDQFDTNGVERRITEVRYDLRVFETASPATESVPYGGLAKHMLVPAQQVYEARDIPETSHKIKTALDSCTKYFWTVRARFKLDGQMRTTEWAGVYGLSLGGPAGPEWLETPWSLRRGAQQKTATIMGVTVASSMVFPDGPEWFYYPFSTPCD